MDLDLRKLYGEIGIMSMLWLLILVIIVAVDVWIAAFVLFLTPIYIFMVGYHGIISVQIMILER